MENKNDILQAAAGTILQNGITLEVDIPSRNRLHAYFQKKGWMARKKTFTIHPVTIGSLVRISKILVGVDLKKIASESLHAMVVDSADKMAEVIAIAIHNRKGDTPPRLVSFILNHFTAAELLNTIGVVLNQMNVSDFLKSIVSATGMNLMETSPVDPEETIASGEPLED